ncbi:hypothetical protein WAI453_012436 [Rhynchosporium graminicola]|uniref:SET domain-containing protein n=1 Tax=Rhynchosporium graminicola TaxID=2792576 RepID=A0A1E1LSN5_9HELO|nr:uncharacterized protein RCO7_11280 [Rhynchosporium commune]
MAPTATVRANSPIRSSDDTHEELTTSKNLWEIVDIPGKGKGIIVTQATTPGTLLLSEAPLLTTDVVSSIATAEADLETALSKLSLSEQENFRTLHTNFPENDDEKLIGIIRSNAYPLGSDTDVGGLFPEIARINHSCLPNSVQYWNELLGKQTIYAVRPMAKGEEITTCYQHGGTSKQRKEVLKEYFRFDCMCELCSLPADELQASDERMSQAEKLDQTIGNSKKVHFEPDEVMKCARQMFDIYQTEDIKDGRLSRLYYDLFQMCNMHSDLARARCFAKYYTDAKKMAEGGDSLNVLEMKAFMKNPSKHESFGSTEKWATKASDVPKGLNPGAFKKWLWREDV